MQIKANVMTCDACGKKVSDEGTSWYGGHPFQGWFHLNEHGGSTALSELQRKKDWDFCSKECLGKYVRGELKETDTALGRVVDAAKPILEEFGILPREPKKSA